LNIVLHFVGIWKQIKHNVYAGAVGGVIGGGPLGAMLGGIAGKIYI
jgi:hypothetical protein